MSCLQKYMFQKKIYIYIYIKIYIYVNPFCGSGRTYNAPSEKSCKLMVFEILAFDFYLEKSKGTVNYCLFERKHIIMKK